MQNLMHSIEMDKSILRLLELQAKYSRRLDQLMSVGVDFSELVIDENLLELALDMLGVPADTTCDYPDFDENSDDPLPEGWFCRTRLSNEFERVVPNGTPVQCLEYVRSVRAWVEDRNIGTVCAEALPEEQKGGKNA
jgi:hypothetical protein